MDENPTTVEPETTQPVVHEVDSNYAKHDIKLPREKKGRVGLIIGIIVGVLVLIGGGIALWFFAWYNNPEQVAYDAVANLLRAENVGFEGGLSFFVPDEYADESPVKGILLSFDNASNTLPNATSAKVTIVFNPEMVTGEPQVNLGIQNVVLRNGDIYLQISGLVDSLKTLDIDEDEREAMEMHLSIIELVDNEWWRISVPELLEEMQVPTSQANALTEAYRCMFDVISQDNSEVMLENYKKHRFIAVKPTKHLGDGDVYTELASGYQAYELSIDKDELAAYLNLVAESQQMEDFYGCINQALEVYGSEQKLSPDDIPEISASDIDWSDQNKVYLEISRFGHQLRSITPYFYDDDDNYIGGGTVLLRYEPVTVTAPENYRPITDLFTEITEVVTEMLMAQSGYDEEEF